MLTEYIRSGSRTRVFIRKHRGNSPISPQRRHGRDDGYDVLTIEEIEEYSPGSHRRPESCTRIHIKDSEDVRDEYSSRRASPLSPGDDDTFLVRRMQELRAHSTSPQPHTSHERRHPPTRTDHDSHPRGPPRSRPTVSRHMSDADRRLSEHPHGFRHGVMVPAPHRESAHSPPHQRFRDPVIERPPLPGPPQMYRMSRSPPRPQYGPRRHSLTGASRGMEEHSSNTKIRSILRSRSRPRSSNWSESPPPGRNPEDARLDHGGPRVSFAPEPPSFRQQERSPPAQDWNHQPGRESRRRHKPHLDGHESIDEKAARKFTLKETHCI